MILKSFQKKTKNGMSKTELPSLAFWQSALFWILFQDICWGQVSFPCIPAGLVKRKCSCERKEREVAQSCPTLCNPVDCSLPGFSVHGILQARILEWAAISFFRGSSQPRDRTRVSCIVDRRFTVWATREALMLDDHKYSFHWWYLLLLIDILSLVWLSNAV